MSDISKMVGRTPVKIDATDDEILFQFSDGSEGKFLHHQDCCERVEVEDVNGDWSDLIGAPLLVADEREHCSDYGEAVPEGLSSFNESDTWTFYTFRSIRGSVDVRWHGSSNGYYSERVDFIFTPVAETNAN